MPFEETFLKLYSDDSAASDTKMKQPNKKSDSRLTGRINDSENQTGNRKGPHRPDETAADIIYFSPWENTGTAHADRLDAPHAGSPTEHFRRLYAESKENRSSRQNQEERSPDTETVFESNPKHRSKEHIQFAADHSSISIDGNSSFSVLSYTEDDFSDIPESNLRLYEAESEDVPEENSVRETVFDLSGQEREFVPETIDPAEIACDIKIPEWPDGVERVRRWGQSAFAEWTENVRHELARGFRIIGFGSTERRAGVSTLLLGLAGELAARHYSVLVLDADFERPSLAYQLGLNLESGWEKFLNDDPNRDYPSLYRVIVEALLPQKRKSRHQNNTEPLRGEESFYILPLLPNQAAAAVAVSCRRNWLARFLELAESFDAVLIDHGLLKTDDDERKISEMLRFGEDGWYLVDDNRRPCRSMYSLIEQAENRDLYCLGRIDNFL